MLDIKLIRENPEKINELLKRRNPELSIDEVIKIDEERRKIQTAADELRAKRKKDSQMIGELKKNGENTDAVQAEVKKIGDDIKELEEKQSALDAKLMKQLQSGLLRMIMLKSTSGGNQESLILNLRLIGIYAKKKILLTLNAA